MDKYQIVLDLIEHPEKYTTQQIEKLLSDKEVRVLYNLLCKTESSYMANNEASDVEAEWNRFLYKTTVKKSRMRWFSNRAATFPTILFTSLAAVALGITFTVKNFSTSQPASFPTNPEENIESVAVQVSIENDSIVSENSTINTTEQVLFQDETLEYILNHISGVYDVQVEYAIPEIAKLHLYYKFDPALSLNEITEQLNTFEQINIRIDGTKIIVE